MSFFQNQSAEMAVWWWLYHQQKHSQNELTSVKQQQDTNIIMYLHVVLPVQYNLYYHRIHVIVLGS